MKCIARLQQLQKLMENGPSAKLRSSKRILFHQSSQRRWSPQGYYASQEVRTSNPLLQKIRIFTRRSGTARSKQTQFPINLVTKI